MDPKLTERIQSKIGYGQYVTDTINLTACICN